ncbi:MAG TPA: DUF502 domain-containing protein [Candidatus Limnocylindrales bacterium]|nr:DUF502 domain-containing protein [Candidatus Limnocylindrales bacterium]
MNRLRNLFIAGLLVLIPVVLTIWILQLLLGFLDAVSQPLLRLYIGRDVPGVGVVLTALIVLMLGYMTSWFAGRRVVEAFEAHMARIPIVGSIYSTTRQVVRGFSSSEGMSFKRTVLVRREDALLFGFVTGEFVLSREGEEVEMASVYVPTNHLYLGDVFIMPRKDVLEVDMTLEEGISAVLSCGGSLPDEIRFRDAGHLSDSQRPRELPRP